MSRRTAAAAPVSAPKRARPDFSVINSPKSRRKTRVRRNRLLVLAAGFVGAIGLFGLVVFHVVLTQGQFRLSQLEETAAKEQALYGELRMQVAELESPDRIIAAAQSRLGMRAPERVIYLAPSLDRSDAPLSKRELDEAAQAASWSEVKKHLAGRP